MSVSPTVTIYPINREFIPGLGEQYNATASYRYPNGREIAVVVRVAADNLREAAGKIVGEVMDKAEAAMAETRAMRRRSTDV